jgi:hypothetical protein
MVEELLQFLICKVDTQLFETVVLSDKRHKARERIYQYGGQRIKRYQKDDASVLKSLLKESGFVFSCNLGWVPTKDTYVENFETSNIQYTNELHTLLLGVQSFVTLLHQPLEDTIEHTLTDGTDGVGDLVLVTTLGDELVTDLDAGLQQVLVQILAIAAQQLGDTFALFDTVSFGLFFATPLLELHATHVHDGGGDLVDVVLLILSETQDVEGLLFCGKKMGLH